MQESQRKGMHSVKKWMRQSVSLKIVTISFLAICLLIPSGMVKNVIHERSGLNMQANHEVRSKWALEQNICAPIITVPVIESALVDEKETFIQSYYHFLPEQLTIQSEVSPEKLYRGIYEVIVYEAILEISGTFQVPEDFDVKRFHEVQWQEAFLTLGISDLRGIKSNIELNWAGKKLKSNPGSRINSIIPSGLTFPLGEDLQGQLPKQFSVNVNLQGSEKLSFIPLGKNTDILMNSTWDSPSFVGAFLPDERSVSKQGFRAEWQILQINRNYPQHWLGNKYQNQLSFSDFGVEFILPSDAYQKSIRSIKYALMNIALTFLIFFVVEVFTKQSIHPFQYLMVGLSIILFYILLVSLSEHMSFDQSYLIAGTSTISMIYLYSLSVFKSLKFSLYLLGLCIVNYAFIYITLQMTEYALLLGAISMTFILSALMYGTRNIDWYQINKTE
jgi:inner membrane protein